MERSVSLSSGRRIERALKDRGYNVFSLDVDELLVPSLLEEKPDLVYIALHGKYGEDGTIQELLEILDIPYTGPGPLSSMIGFNKVLTKELLLVNEIPTPRFFTLSATTIQEMGASDTLSFAWNKLEHPVVVKPAAQGSALGVKVVNTYDELPGALITALAYDERVLIEEFVAGTEVAVSVLGEDSPEPLPAVEIVPLSGYYDFEARYTPGKAEYFVPARLDQDWLRQAEQAAVSTHKLLKCKDLSRVDMIVSPDGTPFVLELNISPGMTETSLLPLSAEGAGLSFEDLVEKLVKMALGEAC